MKRILMPLLLIIGSILFIGGSILSISFINKNLHTNVNTLARDLVESVSTMETTPELVKMEKPTLVESSSSTEIRVPYYWKNGINSETNDYLEGYVPSLNSFQEFFYKRQNRLFNNVKETTEVDLSKVLSGSQSFTKVSSIIYTGDILGWDSDACEKDGNRFICPSWVNWTGLSTEEKSYVMTDCKVEGEKGICIFEDYVVLYYNLKRSTEVRCYSDTYKFCYEKEYLKLLEAL
jgi:hypothetical protein